MSLSTAGLMGACAGLLFAAALYFGMSWEWQRKTQDANVPADARERLARMWPAVRLMLIADFVILAGLGYYAGTIIGS